MSGLLNSPFAYDSNMFEATVTTVDPIRFVCTVKSVRGQYFTQVPWLLPTGGSGKGGMHIMPHVGDQVVISTALTYPIIIGSLPRLGIPSTTLTNVTGEALDLDAGNNTSMRGEFVTNPDKPSDLVPGDHVVTTEGGGIFGVLHNGSIILKASALAQIFLSKFDDLVRVVARNFERFSDVGQQTVANVSGRLYEFLGWERDLARSKQGLYELNDVIGDVAAGEYYLGEPNPDLEAPEADDRLRQYWLKDDSGNVLMVEILQDLGKLTVTVQDVPKTTKTVRQHDIDLWDCKTQDPAKYSQVTIVPTSITLDHNAESITVMDSDGIRSDFGGHFVYIDSSGVHMG